MAMNEVIIRKINSVQNCLQRIETKTKKNPDAVDNLDVQEIVILNLLRAIQVCIDMAAYVLTDRQLGLPKNMRDSFVILNNNGVISHDLTQKMCNMVGFRNIAYHEYQNLNLEVLKSIITHHIVDLEDFYEAIFKYYHLDRDL